MAEASHSKSSEDYLSFQCSTLCDFESKEDSDLPFTGGEILTIIGIRSDGWWKAKNNLGKIGLVPSTFLKVTDDLQALINCALEQEKKATKVSYMEFPSNKGLVHTVTENRERLPTGFKKSTLFESANENSFYSMGHYMMPKLDDTGLSFQDMKYDYSSSSLLPNPALLQRKISLIAARQIPEPPSDYIIKSRHVRMCLHDGNETISNIHSVKAKWNENSPKLWTFNVKVTSRVPCVEDGEIFIRSKRCVPTLGILFELCMKYETNTMIGEMSAGWAFMKLLDDSGIPINSATKILRVGTSDPFTPYLSNNSASGLTAIFKNIINEQRLPRIVVSITIPDRITNKKMCYLPPTLIGPWCCVPIVALYHKVIADDILEKAALDSCDQIQSPLLSCLQCIFRDLDLLDILRICWSEKLINFSATESREENKKMFFKDLFLETVFVVMNSNNLPPYSYGDTSAENARKAEIDRLLNIWSQSRTISLSNEVEYSPFSLDKIAIRIWD